METLSSGISLDWPTQTKRTVHKNPKLTIMCIETRYAMWSQVDVVPSRERLERQSDRWRLGVLHTVQYRCVRTVL